MLEEGPPGSFRSKCLCQVHVQLQMNSLDCPEATASPHLPQGQKSPDLSHEPQAEACQALAAEAVRREDIPTEIRQ